MAKFNQPDPRNNDTQCWVNGLVSRDKASVHVLDSVVQGGDAVWEGLRITKGHAIQLDAHLKRLVDSAHALAFVDIPSMETLRDSIFQTLKVLPGASAFLSSARTLVLSKVAFSKSTVKYLNAIFKP